MVAMVRVFAVAAAICFSVITSDAAQLSISGTYKVSGNTNIIGVSPFNVGDTGVWTFDLAWSNTAAGAITAYDSVSFTISDFDGQNYQYTRTKASPAPEFSTGAIGQNHFLNFDNFSFEDADLPVGGPIGNSDASLNYQVLTDLSVAGDKLTQARVDTILANAFLSEGTFAVITAITPGPIYITNFELFGPTVVPEPGTVGLFGLLAGGFGVVAWRRRRSL